MPERPATFRDIITAEAKAARVPPELALAIVEQESKFDPRAKSPKGALGLMQLMPETAARYGLIDPYEPMGNIRTGLKHFRGLLDKYKGDARLSLAAYNAGEKIVDRMGDVPNYPETQEYIRRILGAVRPAGAAGAPEKRAIGTGALPPEALGIAPPAPAQWRPGAVPAPNAPPPPTVGEGPSTFAQIRRATLPIAGAVVGGAKGAALGAPAGPVGVAAGGVVGAMGGAMGGEGLELLIEEGARRLGITHAQPVTAEGAVSRVADAAQTGAMGEVGGQVLTAVARPVVNKLLAPFKGSMEPYAKEAVDTFHGQVLPSEISQSRALNLAENVAEGSVFGGGEVTKVRDARQLVGEAKVNGILAGLGPRQGSRRTGAAVQGAREQAITAFRGAEKEAWETEFRPLAEKIPAASPRLDAFIAELEGREAGAILPNAGLTAARRVAALAPGSDVVVGGRSVAAADLPASIQDAMVKAGMAPPEPGLTAFQFQKTTSDLGKLVGALERAAVTDPMKYNSQLGLANKLYGLALDDMEALLAPHGKALDAYQAARSLTKFGNERLFNDEITKLADLAPEKIVSAVVRPNNSTAVDAVRQATDAATFEKVQAEALKRLIRPNARSGRVNWGEVSHRLAALGDDTRQALFPKGHDREIQRVADLMLRLNERPAGGIGRIAVQLGQGGAAVGLVTGVLTPASTTILLTPYALAKVFASPTGLKWLSEGLKAPAGSTFASRAATQILSFMSQDDEDSQSSSPPSAPPPVRAQGPGPRVTAGGPPPAVAPAR